MSNLTVDRLDIEITSSTDKAVSGLNQLRESLNKIKQASRNGLGLQGTIKELNNLARVSGRVQDAKGLNKLINSLGKLNQLQGIKISSTISKNLKDLSNISSQMKVGSSGQISRLVTDVASLGMLNNIKVSKTITTRLQELSSLGNSLDNVSTGNISNIVKGLTELSTIPKINISKTVEGLQGLPKALSAVNQVSGSFKNLKLKNIAKELKPLAELKSNSFKGIVDGLSKLPKALTSLQGIDLSSLRKQMEDLAHAIEPLARKIETVAPSLTALNKFSKSANNFNVASGKIGGGLRNLINIGAINVALNRAGRGIMNLVAQSNKYVEDLNLFNASMGQFAKETQDYAETVGNIVGIDPGDWMRNQGVFMTLATGFGVVSDRANIMSKNLTQLGYDISSFFNIGIEQAMLKLQSGLSGELEPLRRIGYDLSQARLKAEALALGITKSYTEMTQAEKAQLRYYAIMTQVTTAQNDMARSLHAPANQVRILSAQFTQLGRAMGNIFIPLLNKALPYLISALRILRMIADEIAGFMGFELPKVDYSGIEQPLADVSDVSEDIGNNLSKGIGRARKEVDKLKATVLGFDELHILNDNNSKDGYSSGGTGGIGLPGINTGWKDFDLPQYDFLEGLVDTNIDRAFKDLTKKFKNLRKYLDKNKDIIGAIGAGLLAWKISDKIFKLTNGLNFGDVLKSFLDKVGVLKKKVGIALTIGGITYSILTGVKIAQEGLTWKNVLKTVGGAIATGAGLALMGFGATGFVVGIGLSLLATTISWGIARKHILRTEDLEKRFGNIDLTKEQAGEWAKNITATMAVKNAELYINEKNALVTIKNDLDDIIQNLNRDNMKLDLGLSINNEEYINNLNSFITTSQSYLDQNYLTTKLLFDDEFGATETGKRLEEFTNIVYSENQEKLHSLGVELKALLQNGIVDGEWIPEKLKRAREIQQEINEVIEKTSQLEFQANIDKILINAKGSDLTPESFELMQENLKEQVQERIETLDGLEVDRINVALAEKEDNIVAKGMSEKAAEEIYQTALEDINNEFSKKELELYSSSVNWQLSAISTAYQTEVDKISPLMQQTSDELIKNAFGYDSATMIEKYNGDVFAMIGDIQNALEMGFANSGIDKAGKANIKELLDGMSDGIAEYERIKEESLAKGQSVPIDVSKGLRDVNLLRALSGDTDAISYLVGDRIANSPEAIKMLQSAENQGVRFGEHLSSGMASSNVSLDKELDGYKLIIEDGLATIVPIANNKGADIGNSIIKGTGDVINSAQPGNWLSNLWGNITNWWSKNTSPLSQDVNVNVNETHTVTQILRQKFVTEEQKRRELKGYATGGFPRQGEMFIAREAGAELVGSIGGRTAVANNDQIVQSVSKGVYDAMMSAMGGDGNNGDIVINIQNPNEVTGREIYRQNISKARREGVRT